MGCFDATKQFMHQNGPGLAKKAGEEAHDAHKDQIKRDDDIQQSGHYENQDARDERHYWCYGQFWHGMFPPVVSDAHGVARRPRKLEKFRFALNCSIGLF
jgi:hypothetical protein